MSNKSSQRRPHGALRDEILSVLVADRTPLTARQIATALTDGNRDEPALNTVLTVLDRLRLVGEVDKTRADSGELLFAAASHEPAEAAHDMLTALLRSKDRTGALANFAGSLDRADLDVLRKYLGPDTATRSQV